MVKKRSRVERAASAGARVGGRGVGAALSSPFGIGALGVVALLGGIFIFRDKISEAFANIKLPFADFKLPDFKFPDFDFKFPDFKFPDFDFKFPDFDFKFPDFDFKLPDFEGLFGGFQEQGDTFFSNLQLQLNNLLGGNGLTMPTEMVENTGLLTQAELDQCKCGSTFKQDAFGNVFNACKECDIGATDGQLPSQTPSENIPTQTGFVGGIGGGLLDFLGLTPSQKFVQEKIIDENLPPNFFGGGQSFIGGQILPFGTGQDIGLLSLSEIIDRFMVTASQAANIKALAQDNFGDFDFGTNTGSGIGSVIPSLNTLLPSNDLNVSDNQFQGLTAQQIANILTGGNISNF